jgi:hypothetical protein
MDWILDKNSLFDGVSIGKVKLCVKTKAITLYGLGVGVTILKETRDVDQEETGGREEGR